MAALVDESNSEVGDGGVFVNPAVPELALSVEFRWGGIAVSELTLSAVALR
jgi:hypothetical protein